MCKNHTGADFHSLEVFPHLPPKRNTRRVARIHTFSTINVKNMRPHRDSNPGLWNTVSVCPLILISSFLCLVQVDNNSSMGKCNIKVSNYKKRKIKSTCTF